MLNREIKKKMRQVFVFLMCTLCMIGCAQNDKKSMTLKGTAAAGTEELLLFNFNERKMVDTIKVSDGKFECSVPRTSDDVFYGIVNRGYTQTVVFVSDGDMVTIDMTKETTEGTPLNDTLTVFNKRLKALSDKYAAMYKQYSASNDNTEKAQLKKKMAGYGDDISAIVCATVDYNKTNCLPAYLLLRNMTNIDFEKLRGYLSKENSGYAYFKHPIFTDVMMYVTEMMPQMEHIGKKFTDVTGRDFEGKEHRLSEYVGKGDYVLVDFWASWCGPCMKEMPNVKACWERYRSKGFNVVGISLDNNANSWKAAVERGGYNWPQMSDLKGWQSEAAATYNVRSIPWNFLCDGEGKILKVGLRGSELEQVLSMIYE